MQPSVYPIHLIVRPGSQGFNAYSMWALAAVAFVTLRDLSTRQLSAHVPSIFVSLMTAVMVTVLGGVMSGVLEWKPVGYTALIWSIVLGFFVFGDVPDTWTLLGSMIVVLMGIYTFYRERKIKKLERAANIAL